MRKKCKHFIAALSLFFLFPATTNAETVLFVPQDNRPVSYAYTVNTAESAGYDVLTPPETYLSDSGYVGSPDKIWTWVAENAAQADALIISTDTLIYGGLVDSRKHNFSFITLKSRLNRLEELHKNNPKLPIYAFGTIMRSPKASGGKVEPFYYADYGPKIFEISYWQDKNDTEGLVPEEAAKLLSLTLSVPLEYLQDWFARRTKNDFVNRQLMDFADRGILTYFCLGHDDTSGFSQSALESRYLEQRSKSISKKVYGSFPGADQLGLLLIARYHVDRKGIIPAFAVIYPLGGGASTMPHYEHQSAGKTIAEHITAVGGIIVTDKKPDILLAVNTPLSKNTGESESFGNLSMPRKSAQHFLGRVEEALARNIPVSIADVFYSNGADNTLLEEMQRKDLLFKVAAYNGWNTASNTIGYAIAQAILSADMNERDHRRMLIEQYLDNWGYQANIRKEIYREQDHIRTDNVKYYGTLNEHLEEMMIDKIQHFAEDELQINPRTVSARFPWGRLFETQIFVSDTPVYPLMKEVWQERENERKREAERIAKEKALAEAKLKEAAEKAAKEKEDNPETETSSGEKEVFETN